MNKIALISLGCAKNLVDSEVMMGHLRKSSHVFVPSPEEADIIIINTCGFIKPAKDEAENAIQNALSVKHKNKKVRIIVTGCYVERYISVLRNNYPEVDVWLGVKDFDKIVHAVQDKPIKRSKHTFLYDHDSPRFISTSPVWAYIKISEGCSHNCSFCTIPMIKGFYRSREIESIIQEVEILVSKGIREINIISQDTTFFRRDRGEKTGLIQLLQKLAYIPNLQWIRLLYCYPEEITGSLLEIMQEDKICSYLDIPFQHSHPRIIKSMNRGMDSSKSLNLLQSIRKVLPDVSIRTSLIVGYPLEGEKEFAHLLDFVRTARFDNLGVFKYWHEEGTDVFHMGDPVSDHVKNQRQEDVMTLQMEISRKTNKKYLKKTIDVLLEKPKQGHNHVWTGRSQYQAPEVDGRIYVENVMIKNPLDKPIHKVEIRASEVYDLHGVLSS